MTNWDPVGGNPCPGNVGEIRSRVTALKAVCQNGRDLESRLRDLHSGNGTARWEGDGAKAIDAAIQKSIPGLADLWSSHEEAAAALGTYATNLERLQGAASAALANYTNAEVDRARAESEHADASSRNRAAVLRQVQLQAELKTLQTRRLAAAAAQQSTSWLDSQISRVRSEITRQRNLADVAHGQAEAASGRAGAAREKKRTAKSAIDRSREDLEGYARTAATAILASVGIVHSNNPFVRAWENVTEGVGSAAKWIDEHGLDLLDGVITVLSIAAIFAGPAAPFLLAAAGVLGVIALAGHLVKWANNPTADNGVDVFWGALSAVPFVGTVAKVARAGRLGKAGLLKRITTPKLEANPLGLVKRGLMQSGAGVPKVLGQGGVKVGGKRYYVHAAPPKPQNEPTWLYETKLVAEGVKTGKTFDDGADLAGKAYDAVTPDAAPDVQPAAGPSAAETSAPVDISELLQPADQRDAGRDPLSGTPVSHFQLQGAQ